jgi:hypothetical protein
LTNIFIQDSGLKAHWVRKEVQHTINGNFGSQSEVASRDRQIEKPIAQIEGPLLDLTLGFSVLPSKDSENLETFTLPFIYQPSPDVVSSAPAQSPPANPDKHAGSASIGG